MSEEVNVKEVSPSNLQLEKGRVVWVLDFNHLLHKFFQGMQRNAVTLTALVEVERVNPLGLPYKETVEVDTTVMSTLLKYLVRLSNGGHNPIVVCCDSVNRTRKAYFKELAGSAGASYKSGRPSMNPRWKESADLLIALLKNVGACVVQKENYEADDLIAESIRLSKEQYPNTPICVLTADLDLVPLVDEQVSVYMYPATMTYAEEGYPEVNKYEQVTPRTYQRFLERKTTVKGLGGFAPYNTLLLSKILRGDKSDTIPCLPGFFRKPKRLRDLLTDIVENEPDYADIFRYYPWETRYLHKPTGQAFDHLPQGADKSEWVLDLEPPTDQIERMVEVLRKYGLTDEELKQFKERYEGMNLNGAILNIGDKSLRRRPFKFRKGYQIKSLDIALVALEASKFQIHIPLS